jgi:RNA polymerase primary sigma factor
VDGDRPIFDDPFDVYLGEAKNVPPLDSNEEMECIRHVRAGDEQAEKAGQRLVEANLLLVVTIAKRHARGKMHILDLIIEGNRGLLTAIQTLSDSPAENFLIHATPFIERAISDALAATHVKMIPPHLRRT